MPDGTSLQWTILKVPFDPAAVWQKRNRLRVRGTIRALSPLKPKGGLRARRVAAGGLQGASGVAFRTSLFRARDGSFFLLVNKKMQKGAGLALGSTAEATIEPDLEERAVTIPAELERLLRQDRGLRTWHDRLSASYRKAIADRIAQVKGAAARQARAEQLAEWMMLAREGERITPPILEAAFLRQPKAREGWRAMTPVQRRGHLMGIFYYQSPESRQKRAQKTVEEAMRIAGKKAERESPRGEKPKRTKRGPESLM